MSVEKISEKLITCWNHWEGLHQNDWSIKLREVYSAGCNRWIWKILTTDRVGGRKRYLFLCRRCARKAFSGHVELTPIRVHWAPLRGKGGCSWTQKDTYVLQAVVKSEAAGGSQDWSWAVILTSAISPPCIILTSGCHSSCVRLRS